MTVTLRDKFILLVLAFALLAYGGYKALWIPATEKIALLEQNKSEVEGQSGDITPLEEKSEKLRSEEKKLKDSVDNIKKLSGGLTTTNEEFLVFLGKSAEENNVVVSGFTDLGTTDTDGIYRSTFDFELKGSSTDINKVLEDINNIGIKCSYGSVSFRQNEKYDYLKRFFDDLSDLPWYKEPEKNDAANGPETIPEIKLPEITIPEYIPDYDLTPQPDEPAALPQPTEPPAKEETPKDKPKSIEERLNDLLEQTSAKNMPSYRITFLANTSDSYKSVQNMSLSVTVCFIMYNEPSRETSFLNNTESGDDAIL